MGKKVYKVIRAIIKFFLFMYCKIVYRAKTIGIENIPKTGAVIFCGNHKSFLDPVLIEVTCKRDDTRFIAKEELTQNKFLAFLAKVFDVILVKRNDKDLGPMREALKTLKAKKCVALFPEGTRNGIKKGLKPKTGVAYFALNSDAVIIPIGIKGGDKLFQKVTITYGKPLNIESYKEHKKDKEVAEEVTTMIMDEIIKLTK